MKTSRPDSFAILEQLRQMERNPFMTTSHQSQGELASLFSTSTYSAKKKTRESKSSSDFRFTLDFDDPNTSTWTLKDADIDKYVRSASHSRSRSIEPVSAQSSSRRKEKQPKEKVIFNRSKHESALERSSSAAKIENKKTAQEVQHLVAETVNMVPVQYLIKHQMFEYVRKRALLSMKRVLDGMYVRMLRDGLYAWYNIAMTIKEIEIDRAVAMLTRVSRGFIARKRFKELYQRRQEEKQRQLRLEHYHAMTNAERATLLQSFIRAFLARKRFNSTVLRRRRAAIIIQRNYRNYHDKGQMYQLKKLLLKRIRAARLIQRVYRGFYGRMLCRIQRSKLRREKRQLRYESPEGLFEIFFEQHGAALRIQRWYWSLGWRVSVLKQRRFVVQERIRNIKATAIQRHIRGFLARKQVQQLRYMRSITMGLSMHTIILVQSIIRRFLVIRRVQKSRNKIETIREFSKHNKYPKYKQRRPSIFYPHLRIGNERNILKLQRRAALIQRIYRIYAARKRFMAMVRNRKTLAAKRIQYWYHVCVYRKWLYGSLRVIQPWWKRHAKNWFWINSAAKRIQHKYKVYRSMQWFVNWQIKKAKSRQILKNFCVRYLYIKRRRDRIHTHRVALEMRNAGEQLYNKSLIYAHIDELWRNMKRMKNTATTKYEMQQVFITCGPQGLIDMSKSIKLLKECKGLIGGKLTGKEAEMIFTKVKGPQGRGLDYSQFLDYLYAVAAMRYHDIDVTALTPTSKPTTAKSTTRPSSEEKSRAAGVQQSIIDGVRFGRFEGKTALILRIVYEYISQSATYIDVCAKLPETSYQIAMTYVQFCLQKIHRMMRSSLWRLRFARFLEISRAAHRHRHMIYCVTQMQKRARIYVSRRRAVRLSQSIYVKCVDDSKIPYWYNTRLGTSFWTKPSLLRELDCGEPIKMPKPDEQYVPLCTECEQPASNYCDQCDRLFCHACFSRFHSSGVRAAHVKIDLFMCVQCDFQVATKLCTSCDDYYCDTCYGYMHRRGRARLHTYKQCCQWCDNCSLNSAHWFRIDGYDYSEMALCTVCYKYLHGDPHADIINYPDYIRRVPYVGPSVEKYRREKYQKDLDIKIAEDHAKRLAEQYEQKRQRSALLIQCVYRAHKALQQVSPLMKQRRQWQQLRIVEEPLRHTRYYRFTLPLGLAPRLLSDTPKERVLKLYPKYYHATVTDAIQSNWSFASKLLKLPEVGEEAVKLTFGTKVQYAMKLSGAKLSCWLAKKQMHAAEKRHERTRERYRNARSSATAKKDKKEKLQRMAHDDLKAFEKAKSKHADKLDNVTHARKQWEKVVGPQELPLLVKKRVKNGVPLPFTLTMTRGSRYALVTYDVPTEESNLTLKRSLPPNPPPATWKQKLKHGDYLIIRDAHFKILTGDQYLEAYEEMEAEGEPKADEAQTQAGTASERATVEDDADREGMDIDDDVSSVITAESSYNETFNLQEPIHIVTDDHIKLNRPWLHDTQEHVPVNVLVTKPFLQLQLFRLSKRIVANPVTQLAVTCRMILADKAAKFVSNLSVLFDDESDMGAACKAAGADLHESNHRFMKYSYKPINLDYAYGKKLGSALKRWSKLPKKWYHQYKEDRRKRLEYEALPLFQRWEMSEDKSEVVVYFEEGMAERQYVGTLYIDLDAPVEVMREYIQRKFRDFLNDICGDSFLFFARMETGEEEVLPRRAEDTRWSRQFAPMGYDAKSKKQMPTVVLVVDASKDFDSIPAFDEDEDDDEEEGEYDEG